MSANEHILFGKNAVREAFLAGRRFEKLLVQIGFDKEELQFYKEQEAAPEIKMLPKERLDLALRKAMGNRPVSHQGIVAFVAQVEFFRLEDVIAQIYSRGESPFLLVLDGITDVRNLGAIARSACSFGLHALVVPMRNNAPVNPEAMKASAGALSRITICKESSIEVIVKLLHAHGIRLVAADSAQGVSAAAIDWNGPLALVMGSEDEGVSAITRRLAAEKVKIETAETFESLNVSVAAGILLHHAFHSRTK